MLVIWLAISSDKLQIITVNFRTPHRYKTAIYCKLSAFKKKSRDEIHISRLVISEFKVLCAVQRKVTCVPRIIYRKK